MLIPQTKKVPLYFDSLNTEELFQLRAENFHTNQSAGHIEEQEKEQEENQNNEYKNNQE